MHKSFETLHAYPDFRSPPISRLVARLAARTPAADMALLAEMVRRGCVELLQLRRYRTGAGCHSASRPHRPVTQPQRQTGRGTGVQPSGAWLTERVWESAVVRRWPNRHPLRDGGRLPFLLHRQPATALDGYFSTEEDGTRLDLFPISVPRATASPLRRRTK